MQKLENWRVQIGYVGVQDRALKLYLGNDYLSNNFFFFGPTSFIV